MHLIPNAIDQEDFFKRMNFITAPREQFRVSDRQKSEH